MAHLSTFAKGETVYSKEQAAAYFKKQSQATELPFIFLSAGVSAELFQETLQFAKDAGSTFNGVLCGRATWKAGVIPFASQGEQVSRDWLQKTGKSNIQKLNVVLKNTATSWEDKVLK